MTDLARRVSTSTLIEYTLAHDRLQEAREEIAEYGPKCVRRLRGEASLRSFAARLGVSYTYLSKIENGRELLSPELAGRILAVLEEEA